MWKGTVKRNESIYWETSKYWTDAAPDILAIATIVAIRDPSIGVITLYVYVLIFQGTKTWPSKQDISKRKHSSKWNRKYWLWESASGFRWYGGILFRPNWNSCKQRWHALYSLAEVGGRRLYYKIHQYLPDISTVISSLFRNVYIVCTQVTTRCWRSIRGRLWNITLNVLAYESGPVSDGSGGWDAVLDYFDTENLTRVARELCDVLLHC